MAKRRVNFFFFSRKWSSLSLPEKPEVNLKAPCPLSSVLYRILNCRFGIFIWQHSCWRWKVVSISFWNILPRCNNSCTLQGENKQSLWEGCQWLPIRQWGPKEWYWCYFPSAVLIERGLTHTINSKVIFKISRVTKRSICQTWILYITQAPCMFDTRMKVFHDMESIIDNWSNWLPIFEEADSCTYSMIVSKPSKPYVGLRGWVRWCFFSQYRYKK